MNRALPVVLMTAAATALSGLSAAPAQARPGAGSGARPVAGSPGGGDPYFPRQGNGGYRVSHYRLAIRYTPETRHLHGVVTIHARTLGRPLNRFDLDLRRNLHVRSVRVNGQVASFTQPKRLVQELVITPTRVLRARHAFTVRIDYGGRPTSVTDPDGSLDGWIHTSDGAFVASEPQGSPTWFPVNDIPRDKATYSVSITVPKALTGVSNGAYLGRKVHAGWATYRWRLNKPVSSYLVTATIGKFQVTRGKTHGGIPYYIAVDPKVAAAARPVLKKLPAIVDYFSKRFGKYPFGQTGAIVDDASFVSYALETATRPLFDRAPDVLTLAHELAHQWFGDDVTLRHWRDIWLNEGFAEWSSWYWDEHTGGTSAAKHLNELLAEPASNHSLWLPPPAHPGSGAGIFSTSVYERGAGTLQALRERVGSAVFLKILRGWVRTHAYGNGTVAQFRAYAHKVSHVDLRHLFYEWLDKNGKPSA